MDQSVLTEEGRARFALVGSALLCFVKSLFHIPPDGTISSRAGAGAGRGVETMEHPWYVRLYTNNNAGLVG